MNRRGFISAFLLLLCLIPAGGQAVLSDVRFAPSAFFVGDHVELRVVFDLDGPVPIEVPEKMPESDWAEIRGIRTEEGDGTATVIIDFTPFAPGTRTLPSMELGSLQLRDIKVPTHSILDDSREGVRDLRGQLLLPGTRLAVALVLALAAMAPFLGFGFFRFAWERISRLREAWRVGRPARRLRRLVKGLRTEIGTESASFWYAALTEALREYLSSRIGRDCRSATTAEIALMPEFRENESPPVSLLEVMKEGDMVKFAGRFADDRSLEKTLETVESAVQEWEKGHVSL